MTPSREPWISIHADQLASRFRQTVERSGGVRERGLSLAGNDVLLRFAGDALPPRLLPALEHLPAATGRDPSLTVHLWEENSPDPFPCGNTPNTPSGGLRFFRRDGFLAAVQPDAGTLSLLQNSGSLAFFRVADASRLPPWTDASPLHDILHWWMADRGQSLVHAAAVGTEEGGVLLVGPGGSGKSTCALACLGSPLKLAGEDYCLVSAGEQPLVNSLYSAAKLDAESAAMLPHLAPDVAAARLFEGPKAILFLHRRWADGLSRGFPLKALLVPRIVESARPSLVPESPARALAALAPSTIFQFPGGGEETFRRLADLLRTIPCYRLTVGRDLSRLPETILSLLQKGRA